MSDLIPVRVAEIEQIRLSNSLRLLLMKSPCRRFLPVVTWWCRWKVRGSVSAMRIP